MWRKNWAYQKSDIVKLQMFQEDDTAHSVPQRFTGLVSLSVDKSILYWNHAFLKIPSRAIADTNETSFVSRQYYVSSVFLFSINLYRYATVAALWSDFVSDCLLCCFSAEVYLCLQKKEPMIQTLELFGIDFYYFLFGYEQVQLKVRKLGNRTMNERLVLGEVNFWGLGEGFIHKLSIFWPKLNESVSRWLGMSSKVFIRWVFMNRKSTQGNWSS